ncbi:MAG: xylulokinase, partial [Nitrososphaerales archaeon]
MACFIGLDVGTTRAKAGLFTADGALLALGACENRAQHSGHAAERPAAAYWSAARGAIREALSRSPVPAVEVAGLSVSAQGVTFLAVDSQGSPLGNAIVAHDERGYEELPALLAHFSEEEFYLRTGFPHVDRVNDVPKLMWLRKKQSETWGRLAKLLLVGDYILYRLTGTFAGEPTAWSSASLFDATTGDWWHAMLDFLQLSPRQLPAIVTAGSALGEILPEVADELGLPRKLPVVAGTMDQVAAALAVGSLGEGIVLLSLGTVLAVGATARRNALRDPRRRVFAYPHALPQATFVFSYSPTAAIALDWFGETFFDSAQANGSQAPALIALAAHAPPGSDGLTVLPHLMGMQNPWFRPAARGVFAGFSLGHGRAHFARALLEGIAYMARDHLQVLSEVGLAGHTVRAVGGGTRSNLWLQMLADVLNVPLEVPRCREAAALGAAILAAVGSGYYPDPDQAVSAMCR